MYLEDLDKATALRNRLLEVGALRSAAMMGSLEGLLAWQNGTKHDVFGIVEKTLVREAVVKRCDQIIEDTKHRLHELGVNTACKLAFKDHVLVRDGDDPAPAINAVAG